MSLREPLAGGNGFSEILREDGHLRRFSRARAVHRYATISPRAGADPGAHSFR